MLASKSIILSVPPTSPGTLFAPAANKKLSLFDETNQFTVYEATKRLIDIAGASAMLALLSPVMLLTAAAVKLTSSGPAVYSQRRLTQANKVFTMYKFRTMREDAEAGTGAVWAAKKDPRITSIGRFLRNTRLDELPQLINVLKGEMSLIGPRPERPEIAAELQRIMPRFGRRLEVKAGITGLAQIDNGYAASVAEYRRKVALDIAYVQHRSMLLDTRIAIKTIFVVITGRGAS